VWQRTILDLVVLSLILRQHQSEKYKESENEKKIEFVPVVAAKMKSVGHDASFSDPGFRVQPIKQGKQVFVQATCDRLKQGSTSPQTWHFTARY